MSEVHFLNVREGDATFILHNARRLSMIDICCGNLVRSLTEVRKSLRAIAKPMGNFGMCEHPMNPIDYIQEYMGSTQPFRFILTHPDMDHLDGFNALMDRFGILNFWDSGVRRSKPDFSKGNYLEVDWNRYDQVVERKEGVTVVTPTAGSIFKYANRDENDQPGGDGLYILAPNPELVSDANASGETNDGSYVILYRSAGGRILIAGDAHDQIWEYVLAYHKEDISNCRVLIAPHHGRKSGRSYDFLDTVRPQLTLFGCAPSEYSGLLCME